MKLEIELVKSKFDGMKFVEIVNKSLLNKLLISDYLQQTAEWDEKGQLMGYRKLVKFNKATIEYKTCKVGVGRVSPVKGLGFNNLRREIRHTIARDKYIDIDMVNAHPVILSQLCKANNIECPYLTEYVANREKIFEQIRTENQNITNDMIKEEIIKKMYGNTQDNINNAFIKNFTNEMIIINSKITNQNKELCKRIEKNKKYNIEGSCVSFVMQHYENKILENMYDYMVSKGAIKGGNCALCSDGIMILKVAFYDTLLEEVEKYVATKTQFNIKLKVKQMNEGYDMKLENDYEDVKEEFEMNNFKLLEPMAYCIINDNNEVSIRKKGEFIDVYQNKRIMDYDKGKKVAFTDRWMEDEQIRVYDKLEFKPCLETPPNVYNTFDGFKVTKTECEKLNIDIKNIKETKIYKHIEKLCGNDEKVIDYFLMVLSRKVKNPTKLTNTAIIMKSEEGAGKDTFFNWFGNDILGEKYYFNDSDLNLIFGTFNASLNNKILIVMNEASRKETANILERIKDRITKVTNNIEFKGFDPIQQTNCATLILLTNNDNPINITPTNRRFTVWECDNSICNNKEYFDALREELNNKSYAKLFYDYFMSLESDDYDFTNNRPMTQIYSDLKEANKPIIILFLETLISAWHSIIVDKGIVKNTIETYGASQLFALFNAFVKENNFKCDYTPTCFGLKLKSINQVVKKRTNKGVVYEINIEELEKSFIEKNFIKYDEVQN